MKKKKISELPLSSSLQGLHTIGVDSNNQSVKVSLEFVKDAADSANEAATNANEAAEAATEAAEGIEQRVEDITHGYFESMGVGTATNLKGQNTVDAEFTYRKSGGNVEVADGNAMIEAIKGNTIAWNQLVPTKSVSGDWGGVTIQSLNNGKYTLNGTAFSSASITISNTTPIINGHKYLLKDVFVQLYNKGAWVANVNETSNNTTIVTIKNSNFTVGYAEIYIISGQSYNKTMYPQLFDLTLIYGSGKEPATVEQFEQDYFNWFGKPLTYEPYDAGSLRNTKVSALKTTGFNQWDEEWEVGSINTTTGQNVTSESVIRCKNYIPVIANTDYHCVCDMPTGGIWGFAYDENYNLIETPNMSSITAVNACLISSRVFHVPVNAAYIRFYVTAEYGTTYNNDICINISDPNRNGEYEPYKESTLPLDVTTLTGKLNGEGNSVVVFADGMNSAGDVYDEIKIENGVVKAIKRVGKVDLGSLDYTRNTSSVIAPYFYGFPYKLKHNGGTVNISNALYSAILRTGASGTDKTIFTDSDKSIQIKDSSYTDAATFKAAMSGVMLYYELAEPEVYVLDDFNLPKLYPVANGGTEEQLSNSPNSLPATLSIRYGLNAAAFIQNAPKNYISKESMTNFLSNLGSAMGGTWTMTWNSSTNKYDFSFTQNRSVDVEQPIEDK